MVVSRPNETSIYGLFYVWIRLQIINFRKISRLNISVFYKARSQIMLKTADKFFARQRLGDIDVLFQISLLIVKTRPDRKRQNPFQDFRRDYVHRFASNTGTATAPGFDQFAQLLIYLQNSPLLSYLDHNFNE